MTGVTVCLLSFTWEAYENADKRGRETPMPRQTIIPKECDPWLKLKHTENFATRQLIAERYWQSSMAVRRASREGATGSPARASRSPAGEHQVKQCHPNSSNVQVMECL